MLILEQLLQGWGLGTQRSDYKRRALLDVRQHVSQNAPLCLPGKCSDHYELLQGLGLRTQKKASKQERLLVQSIAAAAATMEAPARSTSQEPGKAPGKPATQKPTVSLPIETCPTARSLVVSHSLSVPCQVLLQEHGLPCSLYKTDHIVGLSMWSVL